MYTYSTSLTSFEDISRFRTDKENYMGILEMVQVWHHFNWKMK